MEKMTPIDPAQDAGASLDVLIVGAGAAGLMCAIECARRGRRTAVIEHNPRAGRKILISGGGRCNFTNIGAGPENFLSRNPHFAKSALARYTPRDFIRLVEQRGIRFHEKKLGQLFCDGSAEQIVAMLESHCAEAGARIVTKCAVQKVARDAGFRLETSHGVFSATSLVIASGGLSIPKMGATGFGYDVARQFGLAIVEPRPALAPLLFNPIDKKRFDGLAGVSAEASVSTNGAAFHEKLLFTHWGLSGPAVLQASSYWRPGGSLEIDLAPGEEIEAALCGLRTRPGGGDPRAWLAQLLPNRLAARWADLAFPAKPAAMWSNHEMEAAAAGLHTWRVTPSGTAGFEKAEVTAGGVDTGELSSKTFESRKIPGLYFIGEVVDVTGQLGGFNFQWAWASGFSAGQHA
jgi:predicted Rossmann fold flavoprotein